MSPSHLLPKIRAGARQFVNDVRTPGTGSYHQFLTPAEFMQHFGATQRKHQAV